MKPIYIIGIVGIAVSVSEMTNELLPLSTKLFALAFFIGSIFLLTDRFSQSKLTTKKRGNRNNG